MNQDIASMIFQSLPLGMALVFAITIFANKNIHSKSKTYLGLFFSLFVIIQSFSLFTNFMDVELGVFLIPFLIGAALAIPPTIYIYVNSLTVNQFELRRTRHFIIPISLFSTSLIGLILFIILKDSESLKNILEYFILFVNVGPLALVFPVLSVYYIVKSFQIIKQHQKDIGEIYSYKDGINLQWVKVFLIGFALFFVLAFANSLFDQFSEEESYWQQFVFDVLALLYILFIGIKALQQSAVNNAIKHSIEDQPEKKAIKEEGINEEDKFQKIREDLDIFMNKHEPYLEPTLTIYDLAKSIDTNYKYLSKTINKVYGQNFVSYINHFRIGTAKELLKDPTFEQYTIEAIGEMSGFKSKSAFNAAFKKITGYTPSEYKLK